MLKTTLSATLFLLRPSPNRTVNNMEITIIDQEQHERIVRETGRDPFRRAIDFDGRLHYLAGEHRRYAAELRDARAGKKSIDTHYANRRLDATITLMLMAIHELIKTDEDIHLLTEDLQ